MNSQSINFLTVLTLFFLFATPVKASNKDPERAQEIRQLLWDKSDKDFSVTAIPDKWKGESAVVIARSYLMSYRKAVLVKKLNHDNFKHERIMLLDKSSIEEYSLFTIPADGNYGGVDSKFYTGFKIIKSNGKEVEVPFSEAVIEERDVNGAKYNQWKLALPNLEPGDILDYYIVEEQDIQLYSGYGGMTHIFSPVIFQLNGDYPIIKQKITFDVLRKCYINLRTLNGAPEFKASSNEEQNSYTLEDSNRESVKSIRWLYPNRQLPSVKFKVMYTNGINNYTLFDKEGELNSEISKEKLKKLVSAYFNLKSEEGFVHLKEYKKKYKKEKNLNKLARDTYYFLRNKQFINYGEVYMVSERDIDSENNTFVSMIMISNYLKYKKIPHKIIIGVNRSISSLEDLILENELMLMIKVTTTKPFYIGRFSSHSSINEIDPDMQGIDAYEVDGLLSASHWVLKKTTLPVDKAEENNTTSSYRVEVNDLDEDEVTLSLEKSSSGINKIYYQNVLMDFFDYKDDEKLKFGIIEGFTGYGNQYKKTLFQKKDDYMSKREDNRNEKMKFLFENDMDLKIKEATDVKIIQTGRFDDKPEFIFSSTAKVNGAIKKVGNNYLINIGKFIEKQIQPLEEDKLTREYDIYFPYARSFNYKIEFAIPEGYEVQGMDELNISVVNSTGGFTSKATVEGNRLIVESNKYYTSNFEKKENWPLILEFLEAAYSFTQKQILLKKK